MATKDKFWSTIDTPDELAVAHALGVLADVAYTNSEVLLNEWCQAFEIPFASVLQTPNRATPNLMVCAEANRIIVAIPGTINLAQMGGNIIFAGQRENPTYGSGRIHDFFLSCAEAIVDFVGSATSRFPNGSFITFVGHSLGGAVAQILADWVAQNTNFVVQRCLCFNTPRVGNKAWAERGRPYVTKNYYSTHDMVVELPPPLFAGLVNQATPAGNISEYRHRDYIIPITSDQTLYPAYAATVLSKMGLSSAGLIRLVPFLGKAGVSVSVAVKFGVAAGLVSYLTSVPVWVTDHAMRRMLDNMALMPEFTKIPEWDQLDALRDHVILLPYYGAVADPNARFIVDPLYFCGLRIANPSLGIQQPPLPPGGRLEITEAAWVGDDAPEFADSGKIVSAEAEGFNAIFRQAAATGSNPFTIPGAAYSLPPRPNWLFNGKDRRLIEKLLSVMRAIEARDMLVETSGPTAALSNRQLILDTPELRDAWELIGEQVGFLFDLYYS